VGENTRLNQKEIDQNYRHTQHVIRAHEGLLNDATRNRAFMSALSLHVKPGSTVLDIGSGTGIWAITAARLGAKRVVAIERDALLIPVIRNLAKENGVQDRVEVIHGESTSLQLDQRFDCVISETIGNQAFDEDIVSIMMDARKRFLKPGGCLIPEYSSLTVAASNLRNRLTRAPAETPISSAYFEALYLHIPVTLTEKKRMKLLSEQRELINVDLRRVKRAPDLGSLTARWNNIQANKINCFVVWAEIFLAKGIKLSTMESSNWSPVIYPLRPFKQSGDVEIILNMSDKSHYWTAELVGAKDREPQSYSPLFAFASLSGQIRKQEAPRVASKGVKANNNRKR
jgi:precorrin-6B methylase 2